MFAETGTTGQPWERPSSESGPKGASCETTALNVPSANFPQRTRPAGFTIDALASSEIATNASPIPVGGAKKETPPDWASKTTQQALKMQHGRPRWLQGNEDCKVFVMCTLVKRIRSRRDDSCASVANNVVQPFDLAANKASNATAACSQTVAPRLGGRFKTGHLWTGQTRPFRSGRPRPVEVYFAAAS